MRVLIFTIFFYTTLFASHPAEPISLQLAWLHQFQSAGFYVAKEKGFYEELDLNVTIKEYQQGMNVVNSVVAKESTYGVGKSSLVIDRNNGKPIVALMALFQHSPSVLISTNPIIKTPKDLYKRLIMMSFEESNSAAIISMLISHGIQKEDIFLQEHSFKLDDLINRRTDAMACYISNEPFLLNERNISHTILNPKEYGFDFYGDILFTTEAEITFHKERAKRFYTATKQGWEWAFEHIEETAQLIYDKYNTQNKSLAALIYEGYSLKSLAFDEGKPFGTLEAKKFDDIASIYKISGLLQTYSLAGFIDPLHFAKDTVKIGILASREESDTVPKTWRESAQYLSALFPSHQFVLLPLNFEEMKQSVQKGDVEFIITNPMYAIQLEHSYGLSRIATLSPRYKDHYYSEYGSVIFTKATTKDIHSYADLQHAKIGAVSPYSFGGYLLGMKELNTPSLKNNITFLNTHHNVVNAVLSGQVDAGIVRTDVLEKMSDDGLLKMNEIKVLGEKHYPNFPFLVSTELYPEWVLAKTPHTSEYLTNEVLSTLLKLSSSPKTNQAFRIKTPIDYSKIHTILKEFNIYPYEQEPFTLKDAVLKYRYIFIGLFIIFVISLAFMAYIQRLNKKLLERSNEVEHFNETLEKEVEQRTHELSLLNSKLKNLANTDELTKINNRRYFLLMATQYFHTAKRNKMELHILSLDIDFFKHVNDTYGHAMGDEVLKFFCNNIKELIRQSDLFGRIGGEEFCICIQNTSLEGARIVAEKIRECIERETGSSHILPAITVSIGISSLKEDDKEIFDIIKRSDQALYVAKRNGCNQVQIL
jgi:diguanylate cyclase (GGDEF)-like protein